MTDNPYPPEWDDTPPPDPLDPRFGNVLDPWRPTPAERALAADLVHGYVSRDLGFEHLFLVFCRDRYAEKSWPQLLVAILEQFAATAVGAQGETLTIARTASDLQAARGEILEFGSSQ